MPKVALIVNPYSTGVNRQHVDEVEAALRQGADVVRRQTEARGHATELAAEAAETADAIVVYSGDGTYNEAVNGAAGRVPFGFVPGGGASVFPRALGVAREPAAAAASIADALREGRLRSISLGRVNGRRLLFSYGLGFDGEAILTIDTLGCHADRHWAGKRV